MTTERLDTYAGTATKQDVYLYQQQVGSLNYAATITRPDIAPAASYLAQFLLHSGPVHRAAVDPVISYLFHTRYLDIQFSADPGLLDTFACTSDAAFADDMETMKGTEGYVFKLYGGPVDGGSRKQTTVATTSTEAEMPELTNAAKCLYELMRLFKGIALDPGHSFSVACDNLQTICLHTTATPPLTTRLCHVDSTKHWLHQEDQERRLLITWVCTANMPADGLTKSLTRKKHEWFIQQLGMMGIRQMVENGSG